jgi:integrase
MLSTMYAAGPRVSEVANLKVEDIDSGRGILWIRGGKGRKDRRTLLPPKLLELLRVYWRWEHPKDWLFPGEKPGTHISKESIFRACQKAGQDAGISKAVHPHSLRHASAYYTTFQSLFILKTICFGQPQSAAVYGHDGLLAPLPGRLAVGGPCD